MVYDYAFVKKPKLFEAGLTMTQKPFEHTVSIYDLKHAIYDPLRSWSSMEIQTLQGTLLRY